MSAGGSAWDEARRAKALVAEYERRLDHERQRLASFAVASRTEAELAARLAPMAEWGWRLLPDRRWPGRGRANIDLLHVGPGGVLVVDVKAWAEPDVVDGRLYRGQAGAEDEVDALRRAAEAVMDVTAKLGLAPAEVVPVMVFMNHTGTDTALGRVRLLDEHTVVPWAVRRGRRLTDDQVEQVAKLLDARFPPYEPPAGDAVSVVVPEPVLPLGRHGQPEPDTLFDVADLTAAVLENALSAPIEEWMTFLHPDQVQLVRRTGPGPARIRGAAGTGKTVVALHRAALAAELGTGPVLMTTFVRTLPPVLANLYARLSPATADRVEFSGLHAWARGLLERRGQRLRVDLRAADTAYRIAWAQHGRKTALADVGVDWTYWKDEIDAVIKGRGLTEFGQYAELKRVGRRTRLTAAQREIVWDVYCRYEEELRERGVVDVNDLLLLARAELVERPLEQPYAAVIADEVQDLNCAGVRLLAELSGGGSRLLLVGDGQQQIFPGGYTLAEAGLSVTGRSTVLRTNYRNSREILDAAVRVVEGDDFLDLDDAPSPGGREVSTVHDGGSVATVVAPTLDDLRARAVTHVRSLIATGHPASGIAVLVATNAEASVYQRLLTAAGVASLDLLRYCGVPVDAVKVGTLQRSKGLEFKHVVHPVHHRPLPRNASADAVQELRELENRQLFVAMTRARDTLWVGRTA